MTLKSLSLKLLVLVVVIVIWAMQSMMKHQHTEIEIPLKLRNLGNHLIPISFNNESISFLPMQQNRPLMVTVLVEGKGIDIHKLQRKYNIIELDAKDFNPGINEALLTEQHLVLQDPLDRTAISFHLNKTIVIETDVVIRKEVNVTERFLTLGDELYYQQINASITPDRVELQGAKKYLDEIRSVTTIPLSTALINVNEPEIELEVPENVASIQPQKVKIVLAPANIITRTIPLIRIQVVGNETIKAETVSIIPQYVTVKIEGNAEKLQTVRPNNIRAFVDVTSDNLNDFVNIRFEIPDDIRLVEFTPKRVQITQP